MTGLFTSVAEFLSRPYMFIAFMIAVPALGGVLVWLLRRFGAARFIVSLIFALSNLFFAASVYYGGGVNTSAPFLGALQLSFITTEFSAMCLFAAAVLFLFVSAYSLSYFKAGHGGVFMLYYFISLAMVNGALASDNIGMMLFFWEGLLCTLFGILLIGNLNNPRTAIKALAISGTADLFMMLGIVATIQAAGTVSISEMSSLPVTKMGALGCVMMLLGALGKAGAMPFHSWIPNAASDAPTPFLAAFPGSFEKILGIYLITRIFTDMYDITPGSAISVFVSIVGAVTLFLGVGMALVQKDMKRLLSYHAISQVGYMILGIGTALPVGIVGGTYHMLNNILYKSGLFIVAGAIEKRTKTTDLHNFHGIGRKMPATTACFIIFGLSIAGLPGTNGFFSKELIFDAALETNIVFYILALVGAFMTAASFLKLGGAAFFGRLRTPDGIDENEIREVNAGMLTPMCALAVLCLAFGVYNTYPIDTLIGKSLKIEESFSGWPHSSTLVIISCAVLAAAVANHIYGTRHNGGALNAVDHIHYAPGLKQVYAVAEAGYLDPYHWFMGAVNVFSAACTWIERDVSWIYDKAVPGIVNGVGNALHQYSNGSLSRYLITALVGLLALIAIFIAAIR